MFHKQIFLLLQNHSFVLLFILFVDESIKISISNSFIIVTVFISFKMIAFVIF